MRKRTGAAKPGKDGIVIQLEIRSVTKCATAGMSGQHRGNKVGTRIRGGKSCRWKNKVSDAVNNYNNENGGLSEQVINNIVAGTNNTLNISEHIGFTVFPSHIALTGTVGCDGPTVTCSRLDTIRDSGWRFQLVDVPGVGERLNIIDDNYNIIISWQDLLANGFSFNEELKYYYYVSPVLGTNSYYELIKYDNYKKLISSPYIAQNSNGIYIGDIQLMSDSLLTTNGFIYSVINDAWVCENEDSIQELKDWLYANGAMTESNKNVIIDNIANNSFTGNNETSTAVFGKGLRHAVFGYVRNETEYTGGASDNKYNEEIATFAGGINNTGIDGSELAANYRMTNNSPVEFKGSTVARLTVKNDRYQVSRDIDGDATLIFTSDGNNYSENLNLEFNGWYDVNFDDTGAAEIVYKDTIYQDTGLTSSTETEFSDGQSVIISNDNTFFDTNYYGDDAIREAAGIYRVNDASKSSFNETFDLQGAFGGKTDTPIPEIP